MSVSDTIVAIDNRARLVGAVLAASDWPVREQARRPHAVHRVARQTRQFVQPYVDHPAVATVRSHLSTGRPVAALYRAALSCRWPDFEPLGPLPAALAGTDWPEQLLDYYTDSAIAAFLWDEQTEIWDWARQDLAAALASRPGAGLADLLGRWRGRPWERPLQIMPNLLYPALEPQALRAPGAWHLLVPPPPAWGESAPWSYQEAGDWSLAVTCQTLTTALLQHERPELSPARLALGSRAITTLFLEQALDPGAGQAYELQSSREEDLPGLPALVERLRAHLASDTARSDGARGGGSGLAGLIEALAD